MGALLARALAERVSRSERSLEADRGNRGSHRRYRSRMSSQQHIDQENKGFWDELCGTSFAISLGITTHDADALRTFDTAYLDFYPYLLPYVDTEPLAGRRVLEIGLGFGTLGEVIASRGAEYHGVDIAENPVSLMRERLRMSST